MAGGSPPLCCMDYSLPIPSPTSPQTPTNPHGHARQQNPCSLRRAFTDMRSRCTEARGLWGVPSGLGPQGSPPHQPVLWLPPDLTGLSSCSPRREGRGSQEVTAAQSLEQKLLCHGPCKLQCLRAGPWSLAVSSSNPNVAICFSSGIK